MDTQTNACPQCGTALTADGLCPRCLLAAAAQPTQPSVARAESVDVDQVAAAFPQLQIVELIGQGGMGSVFKVRQPKLDRFAALKLLPQSLAMDPAFAGRFEREARLLAKLSHPNIVAVYDYGQAGNFFYLLMEFVDGVNLRQAMRASRFEPSQALGIVPKICEALQYAHDEGVLHRDIKPENILLDTKGRVKLVDFGIAKLAAESDSSHSEIPTLDTALTQAGASLGTPSYMAPEQRDHPSDVDHRADIYSLGVVFYELLTGELPTGGLIRPSDKSGADPRVDAIVQQALQTQRDRRQNSAGEIRTQVQTISQSTGQELKVPVPSPIAKPRARSTPLTAKISFGFFGVSSVLILLAWLRSPNPPQSVIWGTVAAGILAIAFALPVRKTLLGLQLLLGGVVSASAWFWFPASTTPGGHPSPARFVVAEHAARVTTASVHRGDLNIYLTALGQVEPRSATSPARPPDNDPVLIEFSIPEDDVQAVVRKRDAGEPLPVDLFNRKMDKKQAHGLLVGIDNQIDSTTGTLRCRAQVTPIDDALLYPNQFANVRLLLAVKHDVLLIPAAALQYHPNDKYVFVVGRDEHAKLRVVSTGEVGQEQIEITGGLALGENVVVDGLAQLHDGALVERSAVNSKDRIPPAVEPAANLDPESRTRTLIEQRLRSTIDQHLQDLANQPHDDQFKYDILVVLVAPDLRSATASINNFRWVAAGWKSHGSDVYQQIAGMDSTMAKLLETCDESAMRLNDLDGRGLGEKNPQYIRMQQQLDASKQAVADYAKRYLAQHSDQIPYKGPKPAAADIIITYLGGGKWDVAGSEGLEGMRFQVDTTDIQNPVRPTSPAATQPASHEISASRLQAAQATLHLEEQKQKLGTGTMLDVVQARGHVAELQAEFDGHPRDAAQVRLDTATRMLELVTRQCRAGLVPETEVNKAAELVSRDQFELQSFDTPTTRPATTSP